MDRLPLGFFLQAETIMELPRVILVCLALYSRELSQAVPRRRSSQADAEAKQQQSNMDLEWSSGLNGVHVRCLAKEVRIESIQEALAHYFSFQK